MEFAVNYSPALAELVRTGRVLVDRYKCPAWPDLLTQAEQTLPVYVHFPLTVGSGLGGPLNQETGQLADLDWIAGLLERTQTRFINTHWMPRPEDFSGVPVDSREPRHAEQLLAATLRDLEPLAHRFGSERVLVENIIPGIGWLTLATLPEMMHRLLEQSGCSFLFDQAHARLAARGLGLDEHAYISALPVQRIREIHVAGIGLMSGEVLEMVQAAGDPGGFARRMGGKEMDHLPMTGADWAEVDWMLQQIRAGSWPEPWVIAYEFGGVGGFWDLFSKPEIYLDEVPRMASVVKPADRLTEAVNPRTRNLDRLATLEMLSRINAEDARVPGAVAQALPEIARAVDEIAARLKEGGRLIYIGAGTSGRLGMLDASEIPPTYGLDPAQVIGIIAGGDRAITQTVEGAEDDRAAGQRAMVERMVSALDSVVGIAASGRTPYVLAAMEEARKRGALTVSLACNSPVPMENLANIALRVLVGPEVVAGSTRMKAGTAEKMVLNMLSTGVMVRLGKTFGNLMVDVQSTNIKLRARARRIVALATGLSDEAAGRVLEDSGGEVKTAIVSALAGVPAEAARQRLEKCDGVVRTALEMAG